MPPAVLTIGSLTVSPPVLAAPICGVSNAPFRRLARRFGAGLVFTEMVKALPLLRANDRTLAMVAFDPGERPVACQLAGSDPDLLGAAAVRLEELGFAAVDLNCGCPAGKVIKADEGCALMRTPEQAARIVARMAGAVRRIPVTVKCRAGWDDTSINAVEFARACADAGAAAVTVHPRTRVQGFSGRADWSLIARVKEAVAIPVIGNGDVRSADDAAALFARTGCDGVMIGRAAMGNPFLFRAVKTRLDTGADAPPPTLAERREVLRGHGAALVREFGEYVALRLLRRYVCGYVAGLPAAAAARREAGRLERLCDLEALIERYFVAPAPPVPA